MDINSQKQVVLVARALKWSSGGSEKVGHPRFHQLLMLWDLQYYCKSQYYFLPFTEGKGCLYQHDRQVLHYTNLLKRVGEFMAQAVYNCFSV